MKKFDLGIRCDQLLTMAGGQPEVLQNTFLGVIDSKIELIAPWKADYEKQSKQFFYTAQRLVMPGLINGHTHLPMTLLKGLADDLPFTEWLHNTIVPIEQKLVSPEFVKAGTELAVLECVRVGVTTVCDMYFYADSIAEVLDRAGVRGLVSEAILDFPVPDTKADSENHYRIIENLQKKYSKKSSRITPCFGPHAPYSCSDETLLKVKKLADETSSPVVIHVAESKSEVEKSIQTYKETPVARLNRLGILGERTIIAHGVHLTDDDIELIAQTQTSVIYNPESNMKLSSGVAPIPKLLKKGVKVGIGTDGSASNNDIGIFGEMDTGVKLQKVTQNDNTAMTAKQALSLATWGGAHALGLGDQVGSLEVGKKADIIILNLDLPHMQPLHDLCSQLVYSAKGFEVETVICDGEVLFENGKYTKLNRDEVFKNAQSWRDKVQKALTSP